MIRRSRCARADRARAEAILPRQAGRDVRPGRHSQAVQQPFFNWLGVARNQIDCLAVVSAVFDLAEPDGVPSQALLESCEYGWWYAAKLPKDRMIAALTVESARQRRFGEVGAWMAGLRQTSHAGRWLERGQAALADGGKLAPALAPSADPEPRRRRMLACGGRRGQRLRRSGLGAGDRHKALCDGEAAAEAIAAFFAGAGVAPLLAYQHGVFARFRDYLRLRQHLYGLERRWPQTPFWQNRLFPG
jgi:hypothetical protein